MSAQRILVHPKCKTKYRVGDWPDYDRSLVQRGSITFWLSPDAIAGWNAKSSGRRGGQRKFSDLAIKAALTLRLLLHLPLRQTGGFLNSIFELMGLTLDVAEHTTLSRRSKGLAVQLGALRGSRSIWSSTAVVSRSWVRENGLRSNAAGRASRAGEGCILASAKPGSS